MRLIRTQAIAEAMKTIHIVETGCQGSQRQPWVREPKHEERAGVDWGRGPVTETEEK